MPSFIMGCSIHRFRYVIKTVVVVRVLSCCCSWLLNLAGALSFLKHTSRSRSLRDRTYTHTLSLSLFLSHTYTHTHTYTHRHRVGHCYQRHSCNACCSFNNNSKSCRPRIRQRAFVSRKDVADTCCNTLQHAATRCNTLQHAATHCNTLQHT